MQRNQGACTSKAVHPTNAPKASSVKPHVNCSQDYAVMPNSSDLDSKTAEVMIRGLSGLQSCNETFKHTLDFNVFRELLNHTYRHICAVHPEYCEHVSVGMFAYYCGTALWYRLYQVKCLQGNDSEWLFPQLLADVTKFGGFVLPKPVHEFLKLIGDFTEPIRSFHWQLVFPDLNENGHFGKMSADTFYKYMAYPVPATLVRGLRYELDLITEKVKLGSGWRLEEIDYDGLPAGSVFTTEVCGYFTPLASVVSQTEVEGPIGQQLSQVFSQNFSAEYQFKQKQLINIGLQRYISKFHINHISKYPMERYHIKSNDGSAVQMSYVQFSGGIYQDVHGFSSVKLPAPLGNLIPALRLRVERPPCVTSYPYNFNTDDIPEDWPRNLNTYFNSGDAKNQGWNCEAFSTGRVNTSYAVSQYVAHFSKSVFN